jgi:hypothetical protein
MIFALITSALHAQISDPEISGTVGRTQVTGDDVRKHYVTSLGVSFKARLGKPQLGKPQVKVDYELFNGSFWMDYALTGSWFIQGERERKRFRPFFQLGATYGATVSADNFELFGVSLGTGFTGTIGDGVFVRPELRFKVLGRSATVLLQPALSIGWQF